MFMVWKSDDNVLCSWKYGIGSWWMSDVVNVVWWEWS